MHDKPARRLPRVAVTRAASDAAALMAAVERAGGEGVSFPLLRFEYLDDGVLGARFASPDVAERYDWLVCTSRHAVAACARAWAAGRGTAAIAGAKVAAVGNATADALRSLGAVPAIVPAMADARHLATALLEAGVGATTRVLFPRAREARGELPAILRAHGVEVDDVVCYDTIAMPEGGRALSRALTDGELDVVTLASGSAARAFASSVTSDARERARLVSIGSTTTDVARRCNLSIVAEASVPSLDALALAAVRVASDSLSHA